jgi:excisionase family DNA binding protein
MSSGDALSRIEAELAAIRREMGARRTPLPSGLMTFGDVAADLRVSVRTVARLVRAGTLLTVKVGTAPRILRAEVERLKTPRTSTMGEGRPVTRRLGPMKKAPAGRLDAFLKKRPR